LRLSLWSKLRPTMLGLSLLRVELLLRRWSTVLWLPLLRSVLLLRWGSSELGCSLLLRRWSTVLWLPLLRSVLLLRRGSSELGCSLLLRRWSTVLGLPLLRSVLLLVVNMLGKISMGRCLWLVDANLSEMLTKNFFWGFKTSFPETRAICYQHNVVQEPTDPEVFDCSILLPSLVRGSLNSRHHHHTRVDLV
jgi:hypothetical protein